MLAHAPLLREATSARNKSCHACKELVTSALGLPSTNTFLFSHFAWSTSSVDNYMDTQDSKLFSKHINWPKTEVFTVETKLTLFQIHKHYNRSSFDSYGAFMSS